MTRLPRSIRLGAALLAALLLAPAGRARADTPGAFPHLEPWPRSLSLAGIPEALGRGIEAVLENPTGMLQNPSRGASVAHASLFSGGLVRHQAAALCWVRYEKAYEYRGGQVSTRRGRARSAYGLGVTNLSGDLPAEETYGELQLALSYARRISFGLQSGFRLRLVQARSSVDGSGGGGIALDLGLEGELWGCRFGGVARALLSEVRWDRSLDSPLPRGYDLALERPIRDDLTLMAGAALRDTGEPRRLAAAASWNLSGFPLVLRIGPALRDTGQERIFELSSGAGLRAGPLSFDYGFRTGPPGLGEIHRFGVRVTLP